MNINTINPTTAPAEQVNVDPPFQKPVNPIETTQKVNPVKSVEKRSEDVKKEPAGKLSTDELKQVADEMNEIMDDLQTSLGFSVREKLNHQVVIEIKNRETDELIKQIPSEELLSIKEKMEELNGLLFNQSV